MRTRTLVRLTVVAMACTACKKEVPRGVDSTSVKPIAAAIARTTDCVPIDNTPNSCANLLPARWADWQSGPGPTQAELVVLKGVLDALTPTLQSDNDTQWRFVENTCAPKDSFEVTYRAPRAMLNFPALGTGGRSIVVGMFAPRPENINCTEKKFGHRSKTVSENHFKRIHQFVVVTAPAADTGDGKSDVRIGTWASFALSEKSKSGGLFEYKLKRIRTDKPYWWCSAKHGPRTVMYLTCDTQRELMRLVSEKKVETLEVAFERYRSRDSTFMKLIPRSAARTGEDGAWARCGNLGCCVAQ